MAYQNLSFQILVLQFVILATTRLEAGYRPPGRALARL